MFYSASTKGFYSHEVHGENIPLDAVLVSDQLYQELLSGQSTNKVITTDEAGVLILIDREVVEKSIEEVATEKFKATQDEKIRIRDGGMLVDGVLFDTDLAARIAYMELFMQFSIDPTFVVDWKASDGNWVTMTAILYQSVIAAGKAHIQAAFEWQAQKDIEIAAALLADDREALEAISTTYGL